MMRGDASVNVPGSLSITLPMCLAMIDRLVLEQSLDSNVRDHDGELYFIWELALEVLPL